MPKLSNGMSDVLATVLFAASGAATPREAASGQELVFLCLSDEKAIDAVLDGPDGARVFVDPRSLRLLDGTRLDFDEHNLLATTFTLSNPHATSTCGCGTSFSA